MRTSSLPGFASALLVTALAAVASAQYPYPQQPQPGGPPPYNGQPQGYNGQPQGYPNQYGGPPQQGYVAPSSNQSTQLEVGYLYVTAAAWGVGTGIWIDAEAGIDDPGLRFIAPAVFGVGAPAGVFFLDRPAMPRGMPSAIATGMLIGAGEGLGIASYQFVTADSAHEWSFKALARSEFIGSTLGGVGGAAFYYFLRPKPQTNIFLASGTFWGTVIGSELGGGVSHGNFGMANDTIAGGGLTGFNLGLAATAGVSLFWTPSWNQLGWMWGGLAIGTVVSLPVYFAYVDGTHDPRHGLILQGVVGALGIGAGALIGRPDSPGAMAKEENVWRGNRPPRLRLLGGGLAPVPGGVGLGAFGQLW